MSYQELLILLPCHSLEDFPTYHDGDDANSLLASWTSLWHPELINSAGKAPSWKRVDDPPSEIVNRLIVVPSVSASQLPTGFAQRVKQEGGVIIRKTTSRDEILQVALAGLTSRPEVPLDADLVADFLALGYCYLQIELLTRQMRYSSNLDEAYFQGQVIAAAKALCEGDIATTKEKLSACFSVLAEERDHYYPVDAFVVDLVMTTSDTLGKELADEVSLATPKSVMLSGTLVDEMATRFPLSREAVTAAIARGDLSIVGGEQNESRLPLLALETVRAQLSLGQHTYEKHLAQRAKIYGRWRYGLTPLIPGLLQQSGYQAAVHQLFDEGKLPDTTQLKIKWEGLDGRAIDSLSRVSLDASKPGTFLSLAVKLGESMDSDHVATLCLAHWPSSASVWMSDLRRISRYTAALGKFVTLDEYFTTTTSPGQIERLESDRYRSPFLKQAVIRRHHDPISTSVRYWQTYYQAQASLACATIASLVSGTTTSSDQLAPGDITEELAADQMPIVAEQFEKNSQAIARAIGAVPGAGPAAVVINPLSFVRRVQVTSSTPTELPAIERPVYAASSHASSLQAVVDPPAYGFVYLTPAKSSASAKKQLLLVEDNTLRNEFFEAVINPTTGALAALYEYSSRGNRLSQQLAFRIPGAKQKTGDTYRDPDEVATYSVMAADSIDVTSATSTVGEIVVTGRLLDLDGKSLAKYIERFRCVRGSRVLQVEVELEPLEEPKSDPWNSYFCSRFAWNDPAADVFTTLHETRQASKSSRIESPLYVDFVGVKSSTTILTGGLAFHRRHQDNMLDTLLISRGERRRKFKFGIGIDLPHPLHEAISLISPPITQSCALPKGNLSGWLLHVDCRNVLVTSLTPVSEHGKVVGFRARLLETAGTAVKTKFSAFRDLKKAVRIDLQGNAVGDLAIEQGKAIIEMGEYEWQEIEARW